MAPSHSRAPDRRGDPGRSGTAPDDPCGASGQGARHTEAPARSARRRFGAGGGASRHWRPRRGGRARAGPGRAPMHRAGTAPPWASRASAAGEAMAVETRRPRSGSGPPARGDGSETVSAHFFHWHRSTPERERAGVKDVDLAPHRLSLRSLLVTPLVTRPVSLSIKSTCLWSVPSRDPLPCFRVSPVRKRVPV